MDPSTPGETPPDPPKGEKPRLPLLRWALSGLVGGLALVAIGQAYARVGGQ